MDSKVSDTTRESSSCAVESINAADSDCRPVHRERPSGSIQPPTASGYPAQPFRQVPLEAGAATPPSSQPDQPLGGGAPINWAAEEDCSEDVKVWLHIYHIDPYTGWLNWAVLKGQETPIYHVGVEIYGDEWAFNYFDDTWDDPSVSGIINCVPKNMPGYDYQESVCLGPTQLSGRDVDQALYRLRDEWPACTYHLTRRNCVSFAQQFITILDPPDPFPLMVSGVNELSRNNPIHEGIVDYGWSWAKWWMRRQHAAEEEERRSEAVASGSATLGAQ